MEKLPGMAPNGARKVFFQLIQTLPTFWGDMDWGEIFFGIPNFWISRFLDFQNLVRAGLGPGRARLEPPGPKNVDFL